MGKKVTVTEFVVDGSITISWFFEDEFDAYAESVEKSLAQAGAVVPAIWTLEVANALLMGERRKRTIEQKVSLFLTLLGSLPITVDNETIGRAWQETLNLARVHTLTVYDAAYLELALRRGLPLATLDEPLKAAAKATGVAVYSP